MFSLSWVFLLYSVFCSCMKKLEVWKNMRTMCTFNPEITLCQCISNFGWNGSALDFQCQSSYCYVKCTWEMFCWDLRKIFKLIKIHLHCLFSLTFRFWLPYSECIVRFVHGIFSFSLVHLHSLEIFVWLSEFTLPGCEATLVSIQWGYQWNTCNFHPLSGLRSRLSTQLALMEESSIPDISPLKMIRKYHCVLQQDPNREKENSGILSLQ